MQKFMVFCILMVVALQTVYDIDPACLPHPDPGVNTGLAILNENMNC